MKYNVNDDTLLLIPSGENKSEVIENNLNYNLDIPTFKVIEESCEYFGVNYRSRLEGSKKFTNSKYKSPIIVQETNKLIFFPISSPFRHNTIWISYTNIYDYYPYKNKKNTIIVFKNGYKKCLDISFYSFNQQYLKASKLYSKLVERNSKK